ncbi:Vitamin K-dependent protein C (Fragment) [Seminavis robusta]|uniref:Vitamin K-dependent protein C n=1 Tax=Seminavis robusta TaxID=568900 RepID=A0A9N8H7E0_9STRA
MMNQQQQLEEEIKSEPQAQETEAGHPRRLSKPPLSHQHQYTTTSTTSIPHWSLMYMLLIGLISLIQVSFAADATTTNSTNSAIPKRRGTLADTRIVGGDLVDNAFKYPFFMEWEDAKCGASLIHDDIALSAAHCESDVHPFAMRLFMLNTQTETGLFRTIERQVAHPLYQGDKQDYDFMIIKLHTSALVDEQGQLTGAATVDINRDPNIPAVGDPLTAMGYGRTDQDAPDTSDEFREVEIYYISDDTCLEQYGVGDFVQELMFCAGVPGGGRDTCQGDSGGPIIHQATGTQVGAVSFGAGCAQAEYAGVNSRISAVSEWIDEMVCELSDNPPATCADRNGNNNNLPAGPGQLSVTITHDDYPEETAWAFTYLGPLPNPGTLVAGDVGATNVNPIGSPNGYDNQVQIHAEPFRRQNSVGDREVVTKSFTNLPLGRYSVQFGDAAGDGICCSYGNGKLEVTNDKAGTTVWENNGQFGIYIEVILDIGPGGSVTQVEEDTEYDNSWEAFNAVNHPPTFDQEWPGAMPAGDRNAIMVNLKFDSYPEETSWTLYSEIAGSWNPLRILSGSQEGVAADLVSVEVDNLSAGWYRFTTADRGADGICCLHRRGWVSLTGGIITTRERGLVWGNNGEFGPQIDVYFNIDSEGFISQVSYADPLTATTRSSLRRRQDNDNGGRQRHLKASSFTDLPIQQLHKSQTDR